MLNTNTSISKIVVVLGVALCAAPAWANGPGPGFTAKFEMHYLEFIVDHHYSALRMTELAAGTDPVRDPAISPMEGTAPTPDTRPTPPKAEADALKSMARRDNRVQREEILTAQQWLKDWYGISYQPHISPVDRARINLLERAPAGPSFDHLFMEVLSRHHYTALGPSMACEVSVAIQHQELVRYCSGIVHSQVKDIQDMRQMLCQRFSICDYQPLVGLKGRHSGSDGNQYTNVPGDDSE
jgi:uncharacterized protein (DUF305 family)